MPLIVNVSPHGKYHMVDIDNVGGIPVIMKILFEAGFLHGDVMTCKPLSPAGNHILVL